MHSLFKIHHIPYSQYEQSYVSGPTSYDVVLPVPEGPKAGSRLEAGSPETISVLRIASLKPEPVHGLLGECLQELRHRVADTYSGFETTLRNSTLLRPHSPASRLWSQITSCYQRAASRRETHSMNNQESAAGERYASDLTEVTSLDDCDPSSLDRIQRVFVDTWKPDTREVSFFCFVDFCRRARSVKR
jgi:hypothetical protein